jgi:SAM-dependent methyltransferase
MPICRLCSHSLYADPLLVQKAMPAAAQELPTAERLASDRGIDLRLYQCSGCGTIQLDADPVPYWREVIRAAGLSPEMRSFRRAQFGRWVAEHRLMGRKVVEIGCGRGEYLELLAEAGVDAHGIEYGIAAAQTCRDRGLAVTTGFIDGPDQPMAGGPYHGFAILNFLEHIPTAGQTLLGIAKTLVPGGVGLVEVPNFDMILRSGLFAEFIPDHIYYFTSTTLVHLLESSGFTVLDCRPVWHDYILSATVVRRIPLDLSGLTRSQERLRSDVSAFLDGFPPGSVAIWGAGHQALALISLMDIAKRIPFVVDSAPFKQGRFTPATHLPIVPPDRLDADGIAAVIVLAASYTDEVISQIRARHGKRFLLARVDDDRLSVIAGPEGLQ